MPENFGTMVTRMGRELQRTSDAWKVSLKEAVNDAIKLASSEHFWFNEVLDYSFPTVIGQDNYTDPTLGSMGEIDEMYYIDGSGRWDVKLVSNERMNELMRGNVITGQPPQVYSRYGDGVRVWPRPNAVYTVYFSGASRLAPYPLVDDADTNAWMTEGEMYIRALAKACFYRNVPRDVAAAEELENYAGTLRVLLQSQGAERNSIGVIRPTRF